MDTRLQTLVLEWFFSSFLLRRVYFWVPFFSCVNLSLRYLGATVEAELRLDPRYPGVMSKVYISD